MYLVRRVYKTKPGQARKVATIVQEQGDMYNAAGQLFRSKILLNGGTVPGENNVVYLEWIDEKIDSPYREGNKIPKEILDKGKELLLIEEQYIQFYELMIPAKMQKSFFIFD